MKVITIGRHEDNDVFVDDPCASRHHLQIIQHDDGHYSLADFGSSNGTFINGQKISGEVDLNMNDVVRIGNSTIPWRLFFEKDEQEPSQDTDDSSQPDCASAFSANQTMPIIKERHGFVTFWLWVGIISNFIIIPISIFSAQKMNELEGLRMQLEEVGVDISTFCDSFRLHASLLLIVALIGCICAICCYALLLNWKKIGFWGLIVMTLAIAVANMFLTNLIKQDYLSIGATLDRNPILQLVVTPISLVILWAVLQIKKNGVSCWKLLE